jgi:hypothetical protein
MKLNQKRSLSGGVVASGEGASGLLELTTFGHKTSMTNGAVMVYGCTPASRHFQAR